ncbi:MAG TPA: hypothetical protein VJK72_03115 [Candidatus Nanoarchaeia archaeon]|nr:hypothetical protein [Candidatus Nanoarchaeia archaeon]
MKKGQGLPLTTIVIAILVLVVLVVLVAIFTGQIGRTDQNLQQQGNVELISMRLEYGKCRPTPSAEQSFMSEHNTAASEQLKADAKTRFLRAINECSINTAPDQCSANGCIWKG